MITRFSARVPDRAREACVAAVAGVMLCTLGPHVTAQSPPPPTGSVTGSVRFAAGPPGRPLPSVAYVSRGVQRAAYDATSELSNVVVYITDAPAPDDLPVMRAQIRQQDEQFVPHVLAVTRGSVVEFPNLDSFFHNVFSLSGAASFDLGRFPQDQTRARRFSKAGVVKVYCHIHSHMSAVILVFDHPYFTMVDADGRFSLPVVPPGRYTLAAWHERLGRSDVSLSVEAGRLATAALTLPEAAR